MKPIECNSGNIAKMHIVFLTDNFPPESNAPANRTYEHALEWIAAGHQVTVITGAPNFPQGRVFDGYKNRWYHSEDMSGIRVVRVKTFISANEGFILRTLDYCSFMVTGFIAALCQKKPDLIVATSPQFFTALGGIAVAFFRRKPFVLEIRDMWPSSIVAVGAMKESIFIKWMERVEHFLYRRADKIVVVTNSFKKEMTDRGIDPSKIHVVLNGVNGSLFYPRARNQDLIQQWNLSGKFVIGYIGTHGLAHDLDNICEAITLLRNNEKIQFLFAGAGAMRQRVEEIVKERGLNNVTLIAQQPRGAIPDLIALCDLCLVPLKNTPVFAGVIPSKMFECQAMGVPIVMSLPTGEATDIVECTGCGVTVPSESPAILASKILELSENPKEMESLKANSLRAADGYSRSKQAHTMLTTLQEAIEP